MRAALTVAETAAALGTSPQTVRTMLRQGALRGQKKAWGSRYVWEVSQEAVDEFVAEFGRLDGCLLYTSPSPRDLSTSRMPSSA